MGDRANIVIEGMEDERGDQAARIFLYAHWGGSDLPHVLADALDSPEGRARWGDDSYLVRIVFSHLTADAPAETGFGLALSPPDNEYPYLVLDVRTRTVRLEQPPAWHRSTRVQGHAFSYEAYIACVRGADDAWEALGEVAAPVGD